VRNQAREFLDLTTRYWLLTTYKGFKMEIITTHANADFDALASTIAAKKLYPGARIVLPGSQEKSVRDFLSLYKSIIKIELERDFEIKGSDIDKLVIVETRHRSKIGKSAALLNRKNIKIHIYDHHPRTASDIKADTDVYKKTGATTTILVEEIKKRDIGLTPLEATIMALGIYEDTGSLTFPGTTKQDVDAVGFLLTKGASLGMVSNFLHRELTRQELSDLSLLLKNTQVNLVNGVNIAISAVKTKQYVADLALLAHKLMDIENYNVLFAFAVTENKIQMVARSRLPFVDAGKAAAALGGGGHRYSGSASIKEAEFSKVKTRLLKFLKKHIKLGIRARDIMSEPIKVVSQEQRVDEVKDILETYSLDSAIVFDKKRIVGLITLRDIDKAIHHGFGHSRVKGYMSTNIPSISMNMPLHKIEMVMADSKIEKLPVVEKAKLAGVITQEDLLRCLYKGLLKGGKRKEPEKMEYNLKARINRNLPAEIVKNLKIIGEIADKSGYEVFAVGGFVRDLILGLKNYDVDIVVEKDAIAFAKKFSKKIKGKFNRHERFGTATVILPSGFKVDFATARTEIYEYPAALPTVKFATIKQDLFRRDFTINAMAVALNKKHFGKLIDFYKGQSDLKQKRIRVLHNLSFVEDPTRIFRAVRFEQRLGFKIDRHTIHLIKTAKSLEMIEKTEKQRLRDELVLILKEQKPLKCVKRMDELHELRFIHPSLRINKNTIELFDLVERAHRWYDLSRFKKRALELWVMYLMALLDALDEQAVSQVCENFVFRKGEIKRLASSKKDCPKIISVLGKKTEILPRHIYKMLEPLSYEVILFAMAKSKNPMVKNRISRFFTSYNSARLFITGKDLKESGIAPGPKYKEILLKTLYEKIDGKLKSKEEELEYARNVSKNIG